MCKRVGVCVCARDRIINNEPNSADPTNLTVLLKRHDLRADWGTAAAAAMVSIHGSVHCV